MNAKNLMVFFVLTFALLAGVSAATVLSGDLVDTTNVVVTVDGMDTDSNVAVVAGEDITVKVYFTADQNDTDVTIEAELEGEKIETRVVSTNFDVEAGQAYKKVLSMTVPYELKDETSNDLELTIEIDGKEYKSTLNTIELRVQRPSYNAVVKSVTTPSTIAAGEMFPIEVVLKNMGYNDLDDVYVSAKITDLGLVQGPKWFGDLVTLEDCDDDCDKEDTVVGKLYLDIPYNAAEGLYTLEVVVVNDDTETVKTKTISVKNDFADTVFANAYAKSTSKGQEAVYDLLIVNPTNNVKVYTIVTESSEVSSTASQTIVAVPAGSSKTVSVAASSDVEGEYSFDVNILEGANLVKTVTYDLTVEGKQTNTIFVLTVVLALVFLVLLVALIVLLGKKPEKSEEFGESYY